MTYEFMKGREFALAIIEDATHSPAFEFGEDGPILTALKNLERNAGEKPAEYAKGMMSVVEAARKLI